MGFLTRDKVPLVDMPAFDVAGAFARQGALRSALGSKHKTLGSLTPVIAEVVLRADPRNAHDPNAIKVVCKNFDIGFVPANITAQVHLQLLAAKGKLLTADVEIRCFGTGLDDRGQATREFSAHIPAT